MQYAYLVVLSDTQISIFVSALVLQALGAASVVVPSSNCYVLDNSSHIVDFVSYIVIDSDLEKYLPSVHGDVE